MKMQTIASVHRMSGNSEEFCRKEQYQKTAIRDKRAITVQTKPPT